MKVKAYRVWCDGLGITAEKAMTISLPSAQAAAEELAERWYVAHEVAADGAVVTTDDGTGERLHFRIEVRFRARGIEPRQVSP